MGRAPNKPDKIEKWLLNCNEVEFRLYIKKLGIKATIGKPGKIVKEYE